MYRERFISLMLSLGLSVMMIIIGFCSVDAVNLIAGIGDSLIFALGGEPSLPPEGIEVSSEMQNVIMAILSLMAVANAITAFYKFVSRPDYYSIENSSQSLSSGSTTSHQYATVNRKPRLSYGKLQDIMGDVLSEYGQISSDQTVIVTMPAINDNNVPKTAEFNKVLFEVLPLIDTINAQPADKESSEHDEKLIQKFSDTWLDALEFAKSTGLSGLSETERRRAQAALNNVMSPTNEHEMKRNLELLENILSRVTYVNEEPGKVKNLNVRDVLGKKEFVELIEGKKLAIES